MKKTLIIILAVLIVLLTAAGIFFLICEIIDEGEFNSGNAKLVIGSNCMREIIDLDAAAFPSPVEKEIRREEPDVRNEHNKEARFD